MSRGKGDGQVVNGARMIKYRRFLSPHRGTWPVNPDDDANSDPDPPPPSKRQKTKRERVVRGRKSAEARTCCSATDWTPSYGASLGDKGRCHHCCRCWGIIMRFDVLGFTKNGR